MIVMFNNKVGDLGRRRFSLVVGKDCRKRSVKQMQTTLFKVFCKEE